MIWNKFHINIDQQIAHYLSYEKVLGLLSLAEHNKVLKEFFHQHNQSSSSKLFLVRWEELANSSLG